MSRQIDKHWEKFNQASLFESQILHFLQYPPFFILLPSNQNHVIAHLGSFVDFLIKSANIITF